ncbi:MAG: hypothetical protein JWR38_127 [Mucilaginibacter sp.]|nr:hypothetical protein [Mucilaginibacter sp.]
MSGIAMLSLAMTRGEKYLKPPLSAEGEERGDERSDVGVSLYRHALTKFFYFSSFAILVGVSLPDTIVRELSAIALIVEVMLLTSSELNSSFTV